MGPVRSAGYRQGGAAQCRAPHLGRPRGRPAVQRGHRERPHAPCRGRTAATDNRSDALLIATPEYNTSIPGVLKNALDWASRPYGESVLENKPVVAIGTSPLPTGAASALSDLQRVLTAVHAQVIEAELAIPQVHTRIDAQGRIPDPELAARIRQLVIKVVQHVSIGGQALAVA